MYFHIKNERCGDYVGSITSTKIQCWLNEDGSGEYFDYTSPMSVPDYAMTRSGMTAEELCNHCRTAHKNALAKYIKENPHEAAEIDWLLTQNR